jgi:hypothetical protein
LAAAKLAYAESYVFVRQEAEVRGSRPTADDARMGARMRLDGKHKMRDPEIIRLELAMLGVTAPNLED